MQSVSNFHNNIVWCAWVYLRGENRNNYSMMQLVMMDFSHFYFDVIQKIFFFMYVSYNLSSCASHMTHVDSRMQYCISSSSSFYYYVHNCLFSFNRKILSWGCFEPSVCFCFLWEIIKTIKHRRGTKRR